MSGRVLGALQVAVMLIAASYGIGFLFGSGEAALTQGIAGGLYGVATAAGMLVLAIVAKPLWRSGVPVWDLFGAAFGPASQMAVAFLSLLWMAGVLAAQVHGGTAVLGLLGLSSPWTYAVVLVLIYGASLLDLRLASAVFSVCLLASAVVLAYALFASGGASIYASALPRFVADLGRIDPQRLVAATLAVGVLVCLGADYHQFVVAGRSASAAAWGCLLAPVWAWCCWPYCRRPWSSPCKTQAPWTAWPSPSKSSPSSCLALRTRWDPEPTSSCSLRSWLQRSDRAPRSCGR